MLTLVIFLMGNNSNIDDEGGGGQKGHFCDDVICERSLSTGSVRGEAGDTASGKITEYRFRNVSNYFKGQIISR